MTKSFRGLLNERSSVSKNDVRNSSFAKKFWK